MSGLPKNLADKAALSMINEEIDEDLEGNTKGRKISLSHNKLMSVI